MLGKSAHKMLLIETGSIYEYCATVKQPRMPAMVDTNLREEHHLRNRSALARDSRKVCALPLSKESMMNPNQSRVCAVLFLALVAAACGAHAQDYPAKPVSLVMPFPAGGPGDAMARNLASAMSAALKQQMIVENPAGAGGTIGNNKVAKSKPDGYTLLIMNIGISAAPALYRSLSYNIVTDFEHIGRVADVPMTIVARSALPAGNLKEFLAYAKAGGKKLTFANAGLGSAAHLCALLFASTIQTEFTAVPYKGAAPALIDLMGGHVDLLCDQTSTTSAQIKAGAIKVYGVTSKTRVATLPAVPTLDEQGLAGFEMVVWYGLWAPKGTPKPVLDKLVAALQTAVVDPAFKSRLADLGGEPVPLALANPDALRSLVVSEVDRWGPIIRKLGVYAD
jgi:tripartite-type tricarboxylate transporter receptor subunit TctC